MMQYFNKQSSILKMELKMKLKTLLKTFLYTPLNAFVIFIIMIFSFQLNAAQNLNLNPKNKIESKTKNKAQKAQNEDMAAVIDISKPRFFTMQDNQWIAAFETLPKGAMMSIMEGDPSLPGPFTVRIKFPENYTIPAHWHPNDEHISVLSGQLMMGLGDQLDTTKAKVLTTGSFARIPPKIHHYTWTEEETIVQLHGQGPWGIMYVNPQDDPTGHLNNNDAPKPKEYFGEE